MAIKKLKFNKDGLVEEQEVDKKTPAPPKPLPPPPRRPSRSAPPPAKPAKTVEKLSIDGKNPEAGKRPAVRRVEDLVTRVRCPRCGSERVVSDPKVKLECGLCGSPMRLVT